MATANSTANAYLRTRVFTAPPEELRLMLLDGAIRFALQGREGLARKDFEAAHNGLSQCRTIILELLTTMRPDADPDLCTRVRSLYTFLFSELVEASFEKSLARIDEVVKLLQYERETWALLMTKLASERAAQRSAEPAAVGAPARGPISVEA